MYSNYNIVTSICIDEDLEGSSVEYITLGGKFSGQEKRYIYWRCVYTFFASSVRVNKKRRHIVYTNDKNPVVLKGYDIKDELQNLGVEVIMRSFSKFNPGRFSRTLRNAFYKFEVIDELASQVNPSLFLDSDCVFHKKSDALDAQMLSGKHLLLQDTYQRNYDPSLKVPHELSMEDMGDVYRSINSDYPKEAPVWYGGELVGGTPNHFKEIESRLTELFKLLYSNHLRGKGPQFANGQTMFDNDEFLTSYVYNSMSAQVLDTHDVYSRRIWTWDSFYRVRPTDINLPIWHLPAEKRKGLELLYWEIINKKSSFWKENDITGFIGKYVGIPKRLVKPKHSLLLSIIARLKNMPGRFITPKHSYN